MNKSCHQQGFTLIELMIVIVVVAILASLALPSYQDSVRKARRSDAQAVLVESANIMERAYTELNTYNSASTALPFATSPKSGGTTYYNLSFSARSATSYAIQADPTGSQTADSCNILTLSSTGAKTASGTGNCW